jgi:hypothetical protein
LAVVVDEQVGDEMKPSVPPDTGPLLGAPRTVLPQWMTPPVPLLVVLA